MRDARCKSLAPNQPSGVAPGTRVRVMLPLPLDAGTYDYRLPLDLPVSLGSFVVVPLGTRESVGVIWDGEPDPALSARRLKNVQAVLDAPPMSESLRRFVEWVAAYTLSAPGAVLRMAMS